MQIKCVRIKIMLNTGFLQINYELGTYVISGYDSDLIVKKVFKYLAKEKFTRKSLLKSVKFDKYISR